jgi:hypothetical protein
MRAIAVAKGSWGMIEEATNGTRPRAIKIAAAFERAVVDIEVRAIRSIGRAGRIGGLPPS